MSKVNHSDLLALFPGISGLLFFEEKAHFPFGFFGWSHETADDLNNVRALFVVILDTFFQFGQFPGRCPMAGCHLAELDKTLPNGNSTGLSDHELCKSIFQFARHKTVWQVGIPT